MATQTRTQRQAAAKKAAATRKRNQASSRTTAAKRSARSTQRATGEASRNARGAVTQATRAATRGFEAGALRVDAVGRQIERAFLIQVGAVLEARDATVKTVRTYTRRGSLKTRLRRFERRGESALRRSTRRVQREVKSTRRDIDRQAGALRSDAGDLIERLNPTA